MAFAALIALSPTAKALTLTYEEAGGGHNVGDVFLGGGFRINLDDLDMGTLYPTTTGTTTAGWGENGTGTQTLAGGQATLDSIQTAPAKGAIGSEDSWGVARVKSITDSAGFTIWSELGKNAQLTVMFYGEQDFYVKTDDNTQTADGTGLHADLYLQSKSDGAYTPYDPTHGSAFRTGLSTYTTVTDGEKILTTVSVPGFLHSAGQAGGLATEFESHFIANSTTLGGGKAYLNVTGGTNATQFDTNGFTSLFAPGTADLSAEFTTGALGVPGNPAVSDWLANSNDPIRGTAAVPDNGSTLLMLGLGLGFLAEAYRRRSKNA